jgi:hypothetical protein
VGSSFDFDFVDTYTHSVVGNGGGTTGSYASYVVLGSENRQGVFTPYTDGGKFDFVIGFNDSSRVDADYDDLVVGFKATPAVPEPASSLAMLVGLAAVGLRLGARRRAI